MIADILQHVRQLEHRIRRYVWIEGLALAVLWLGLTFWIGLALDYLPVRMGSNEMPVAARAVMLLLVSVIALGILYRFVWRRMRAKLSAGSLAVAIERAFPDFRDSLVTSVELGDSGVPSEVYRQLLSATRVDAAKRLQHVDVDQALNYRPLFRACASAGLAVVSIVMLAILASSLFTVSIKRLYGLSDSPYPRQTMIEAVGFSDGHITVARGSDFRLHVRADATRPTAPPNVCTLHFQTEQGGKGRANLSKQGAPRDGFQHYSYDDKPFRNILSDVRFDIVGGDSRLIGYRVNVVDSPQVVGIDLDFQMPEYTGLLPRREPYYNGMQLVRGTSIRLKLAANKPIARAVIRDVMQDAMELAVLEADGRLEFEYAIDALQGSITHEVFLTDTDGIHSLKPYRIMLGALDDQIPRVDARLVAISNAVTSEARIPIEGDASDDFGIDQLWINLDLNQQPAFELPIRTDSDGRVDAAIDLRSLQRDANPPLELPIGGKLTLSVRASDFNRTSGAAQVGESDPYELEIVTPSQLLAMLEARELGLRRRFEQTISEVRETRDSLARVGRSDHLSDMSATESDTNNDTGDAEDHTSNVEEDPAPTASREQGLNVLRVQRAKQHSERAGQEVLGVALSFDDIRQELINNRVDSTERQTRIERDIANPLLHIAEALFPQLTDSLGQLEGVLQQPEPTAQWTATSLRQIDEILVAMEAVLNKMLDLETYNELIDQMRSLIRDQDSLIEETKRKRRQSTFDLLRD